MISQQTYSYLSATEMKAVSLCDTMWLRILLLLKIFTGASKPCIAQYAIRCNRNDTRTRTYSVE